MTSPVLAQREWSEIFSWRIRILRPKITLKRCIWRSHLFRPVQVPSVQFKVQYWPRGWPEKFSQQVHYKLDQYGNFQCLVIIESILECGLLKTLLISPTPALNSHQGQPRNKIRVRIDFEKEQEKIREMRDWKKNLEFSLSKFSKRFEHVEILKLR